MEYDPQAKPSESNAASIAAVGAANMTDPLEQDLAKYQEILPTLSASEGKYAVIFKGELKGIFETYADALGCGYKEAGLQPFLVKRIATTELVAYFTRDIDSSCHT